MHCAARASSALLASAGTGECGTCASQLVSVREHSSRHLSEFGLKKDKRVTPGTGRTDVPSVEEPRRRQHHWRVAMFYGDRTNLS